MQGFPWKNQDNLNKGSGFETDLIDYLSALKWREFSVNLPELGNFRINSSFFKRFDYSSAKGTLNVAEDQMWCWPLDASGRFTVSSLRYAIDDMSFYDGYGLSFSWLNTIPSKVNVSNRRILHHSLPTCANLIKRGIQADNSLCKFCGEAIETHDHIFTDCKVSSCWFEEFRKWWCIGPLKEVSIKAIFSRGMDYGLKGKLWYVFQYALYTLCWAIWKYRNDKVIGESKFQHNSLIAFVQHQAFYWIKSRSKVGKEVNSVSWCCSPFELFTMRKHPDCKLVLLQRNTHRQNRSKGNSLRYQRECTYSLLELYTSLILPFLFLEIKKTRFV